MNVHPQGCLDVEGRFFFVSESSVTGACGQGPVL